MAFKLQNPLEEALGKQSGMSVQIPYQQGFVPPPKAPATPKAAEISDFDERDLKTLEKLQSDEGMDYEEAVSTIRSWKTPSGTVTETKTEESSTPFGANLVAGAIGGAPKAAANVLGFASKLGSYVNPMTYIEGNREEQNAQVQAMLNREAQRQSEPITSRFDTESAGYRAGELIPQGIMAAAPIGAAKAGLSSVPSVGKAVETARKAAPLATKVGIGAAEGAAYGASVPITEKGSQATGGDIAESAAIGGAIGGAIPAIGAGIKSVKNAISSEVSAIEKGLTKAESEALKTIVPKDLKPTEMVELKKAGKIRTKQGITGEGWTYVPDKSDVDIAKASAPYIKPGASTSENVTNLQNGISELADQTKKEIAEQGDSIFNKRQLYSKIDKIERPVMISSDATLNNAYDNVIKKVKELVESNKKQYSSLLDTRKEFDRFVERQFPDLYSNERLTPMKRAIMDVRSTLNDFIADGLPKGNRFREFLRMQSNLYKAIDMVAPQKDINKIGRILKNPFVKVGIGAGAVGAGINELTR